MMMKRAQNKAAAGPRWADASAAQPVLGSDSSDGPHSQARKSPQPALSPSGHPVSGQLPSLKPQRPSREGASCLRCRPPRPGQPTAPTPAPPTEPRSRQRPRQKPKGIEWCRVGSVPSHGQMCPESNPGGPERAWSKQGKDQVSRPDGHLLLGGCGQWLLLLDCKGVCTKSLNSHPTL